MMKIDILTGIIFLLCGLLIFIGGQIALKILKKHLEKF